MPRDGSGNYSLPPSTAAISSDEISSAKYNTLTSDLEADANAVRPIVAGGTGGNTAAAARTALGLGTAAVASDSDYAKTANNLSDLGDAATARTNIGLGTAALKAEADFVAQSGSVQSGGIGGMLWPAAALQDWNFVDHTKSGWSQYLLNGTWANGPQVGAAFGGVYHVQAIEYASRDGYGRVMQVAYPYIDYGTDKAKNSIWYRHKDIGAVWGTWRRVLTDLDNGPDYETTITTWTANSAQTLAHGIGSLPSKVEVTLVCRVADGGYAIGDEFDVFYNQNYNYICGIGVAKNTTNIKLQFLNVNYVKADASGHFSISDGTNWDIKVKAWR